MRGIRATEAILRRAGVTGMIAGQTMDVLSEGETPREDLVRFIHSHKTADLLTAPVEAGLTLAGATEEQITAGREYAFHMGLAFQMTDDLLDVTGDAADIIERIGDIPEYTGTRELLAQLTGYTLTRGVLCAMRRPQPKPLEDICRDARRIVVIEGVVDTTNIGAIFRSAAALGIEAEF